MVAPVSASSISTASAAAAASRISAGGARALSTGAEEVGGATSTNAFTTGYENILYNDYGQRRHGREGDQHPQRRRHPSDAASPNAPSRQKETQDGDFAVKLSEALRNRPPVIHDTEDASVNAYVAVSRSTVGGGHHGRGRLLDFII